MKMDRLLARFLRLPCRGCPSLTRSCQSLSSLQHCWHALERQKKPWSRGVSWTRWTWHLRIRPKWWLFTRTSMPLRVSVCGARCSVVGGHVPGDRREAWNHLDLRGELGWHLDLRGKLGIWPNLSSSLPIWGLPASRSSHRHHFSQDFFSTVFIFVIAWTPSTLKPQESAGAQSHHS